MTDTIYRSPVRAPVGHRPLVRCGYCYVNNVCSGGCLRLPKPEKEEPK